MAQETFEQAVARLENLFKGRFKEPGSVKKKCGNAVFEAIEAPVDETTTLHQKIRAEILKEFGLNSAIDSHITFLSATPELPFHNRGKEAEKEIFGWLDNIIQENVPSDTISYGAFKSSGGLDKFTNKFMEALEIKAEVATPSQPDIAPQKPLPQRTPSSPFPQGQAQKREGQGEPSVTPSPVSSNPDLTAKAEVTPKQPDTAPQGLSPRTLSSPPPFPQRLSPKSSTTPAQTPHSSGVSISPVEPTVSEASTELTHKRQKAFQTFLNKSKEKYGGEWQGDSGVLTPKGQGSTASALAAFAVKADGSISANKEITDKDQLKDMLRLARDLNPGEPINISNYTDKEKNYIEEIKKESEFKGLEIRYQGDPKPSQNTPAPQPTQTPPGPQQTTPPVLPPRQQATPDPTAIIGGVPRQQTPAPQSNSTQQPAGNFIVQLLQNGEKKLDGVSYAMEGNFIKFTFDTPAALEKFNTALASFGPADKGHQLTDVKGNIGYLPASWINGFDVNLPDTAKAIRANLGIKVPSVAPTIPKGTPADLNNPGGVLAPRPNPNKSSTSRHRDAGTRKFGSTSHILPPLPKPPTEPSKTPSTQMKQLEKKSEAKRLPDSTHTTPQGNR